jgi:hypothetical protein
MGYSWWLIEWYQTDYQEKPRCCQLSSTQVEHTHKISVYFPLGEYLPSTKEYNNDQKRWQRKTSLSSGQHTLTAQYGGKTYGPVTFLWRAIPGEGLDRYKIYTP